MSLLSFVQNVSQFIVGPFGISIITIGIGLASMGAVFGAVRWSRVGEAILGGAVMFSSAWIVTTWLQG